MGFWVRVLGLSKAIIQPTQLGFGLSLAGVWQFQYLSLYPIFISAVCQVTTPHYKISVAGQSGDDLDHLERPDRPDRPDRLAGERRGDTHLKLGTETQGFCQNPHLCPCRACYI